MPAPASLSLSLTLTFFYLIWSPLPPTGFNALLPRCTLRLAVFNQITTNRWQVIIQNGVLVFRCFFFTFQYVLMSQYIVKVESKYRPPLLTGQLFTRFYVCCTPLRENVTEAPLPFFTVSFHVGPQDVSVGQL